MLRCLFALARAEPEVAFLALEKPLLKVVVHLSEARGALEPLGLVGPDGERLVREDDLAGFDVPRRDNVPSIIKKFRMANLIRSTPD